MSIHESMLNFAHIYGKFEHTVKLESKPDHITQLQYNILLLLSTEGKSPSDIAHCMNLSMPNTSREIRSMMSMDLLIKIQDKKDKRKHCISLSSLAQEMMMASQARIETSLNTLIGQYSKETLDKMEAAFNLLAENLDV